MVRISLCTLLACAASIVGGSSSFLSHSVSIILTVPTVNAGAQAIGDGALLRILPIGASQIAGKGSTDGNGWRKMVRDRLQSDNYVVDYVGTQPYGNIPAPNDETEAYPAKSIFQAYNLSLTSGAWDTKPNLVIVTLGTNNCLQGTPVPYRDALVQMSQLLEHVHELLPAALTLVAGVVPWLADGGLCIPKLNNGIAQAVVQQQAYGQNVEYVDLYNVLNITTDYQSDGIHPTDAGYVKLANAWYEAIATFESQISEVPS